MSLKWYTFKIHSGTLSRYYIHLICFYNTHFNVNPPILNARNKSKYPPVHMSRKSGNFWRNSRFVAKRAENREIFAQEGEL